MDWVMYGIVVSLYCTPETTRILYVDCISLKKILNRVQAQQLINYVTVDKLFHFSIIYFLLSRMRTILACLTLNAHEDSEGKGKGIYKPEGTARIWQLGIRGTNCQVKNFISDKILTKFPPLFLLSFLSLGFVILIMSCWFCLYFQKQWGI